MTSEILSVAQTGKSLYLLFIDYEEGNIGDAVGQVCTVPGTRDEGTVPTQVLSTNDTLRAMWASPSGAIWVASADGNVGTTAKVSWPPVQPGVQYTTASGPKWSATSLPKLKTSKLPPNVTTLWGAGDSDVHAACFGGHLYHWNGKDWRQLHEGSNDANTTIAAFGGIGPKDVYAAGAQDTLLQFDGSAWRPLAVPGAGSNGNEGLTAVQPLADDGRNVLIAASGDQGRLLHGNAAAGWTEIGRYPIELIGAATIGDRLLFATGNGVAELVGRDVKMIKDTFSTAAIFPGIGRVFLIEPTQEYPGYVEYKPDEEDAWWGFEY